MDDEVKERIGRAMRGKYASAPQRASALLRIVNGNASDVERERCVREIIEKFSRATAGTMASTHTPPGLAMTETRYEEIKVRVYRDTEILVTDLLEKNETVSYTAGRILDYLENDLSSEEERAVAFALILQSKLVPYVRIPPDLFEDEHPDETRPAFRAHVLHSASLIRRVLDSRETLAKKARAIRRILASHNDPHEVDHLLTVFCEQGKTRPASRSKVVDTLLITDERTLAFIRSMRGHPLWQSLPEDVRAFLDSALDQHKEKQEKTSKPRSGRVN